MKKSKENSQKIKEKQDVDSSSRRKVLKKAAYIAPTVITLGVLGSINSAYAWSPPPPPTNDPRFRSDPRFRNYPYFFPDEDDGDT